MQNGHLHVNSEKAIFAAAGLGISQDRTAPRAAGSSLKHANKYPPPTLQKLSILLHTSRQVLAENSDSGFSVLTRDLSSVPASTSATRGETGCGLFFYGKTEK